MAQKRMFDKAITGSDQFLNLSLTAQVLYFHLGMEADDEGFVGPQKIMRILGSTKSDIKNLIETGFVIPFDSGVVVITHWNKNNYLDRARIRPTLYEKESKMLGLTNGGMYELNIGLTRVEESSTVEKNTPSVRALYSDIHFEEFWKEYPRKVGKGAAWKTWEKLKVSDDLHNKILESVRKYRETEQWQKDGGRFVPHPTTFLNQRRFDDEIEERSEDLKAITV